MIDATSMHELQALSRLKLEPDEEKNLAGQLEDILRYFERLSVYGTDDIDPDIGSAVDPEELRTDDRGDNLGREALERLAVEFEDGHFVVPRILGDAADG